MVFIQKRIILICMAFLLLIQQLYALEITKVLVKQDLKNRHSLLLIFKSSDELKMTKPEKNKLVFRSKYQIKVDEQSLKELPENINIDYGYDSLLVSTLKSDELKVKEIKQDPLTYQINYISLNEKAKIQQNVQLLIVKLRLAQTDNNFSEGEKIVKILEDNYMDNPQVILALSQYAFDIGQYRRALRLLNKLDKEFPNFHKDDQLRAAIYQQRNRFIMESLIEPENPSEANFPFLSYKDDDEEIDRFQLAAQSVYISPNEGVTQINTSTDLTYAATSNSNVGVLLQNILYNDPAVQNPWTGLNEGKFASRFNGELYFQHFLDGEDYFQLGLYAGYQSLLGGGINYNFWIPKGAIRLNLDVNKPVALDQLELGFGIIPVTIIYGGTVDQVFIDGNYNITNNLLWLYNTGVAQYSIHNYENADESINLFTSLSYNLNSAIDAIRFLNTYGQYFISYSVNAQYMVKVENAIGSNGNQYNPIPLFTYEIHTLELSWQDLYYHQRIQPLLYIGASLNRYGGNLGLIFGGELTYIFDDSHTISVFAARSISSQFQNTFSDTAGLRFYWYF